MSGFCQEKVRKTWPLTRITRSQARIGCLPHFAHAACVDGREDFVRAELHGRPNSQVESGSGNLTESGIGRDHLAISPAFPVKCRPRAFLVMAHPKKNWYAWLGHSRAVLDDISRQRRFKKQVDLLAEIKYRPQCVALQFNTPAFRRPAVFPDPQSLQPGIPAVPTSQL